MSALVAYWPQTHRLEAWGGFPSTPGLAERGMADGVGARYQRMADEGEIATYPGRSMSPGLFVRDCLDRLAGSRIRALGADRYRQADVVDALASGGWRHGEPVWRGTGAHTRADGSYDVRAFQRAVLRRTLAVRKGSVLWASAIRDSEIRTDASGNPAIEKARSRGRIDVLQAGVIALGLAHLAATGERLAGGNRPRFFVVN